MSNLATFGRGRRWVIETVCADCHRLGVICPNCAKALRDKREAEIEARKTKVNYSDYIQTPQWKKKSKEAKLRAGYRCQVCNRKGSEHSLHSHHRTYKRLGNERPSDITVLCKECHELFHANGKIKHD